MLHWQVRSEDLAALQQVKAISELIRRSGRLLRNKSEFGLRRRNAEVHRFRMSPYHDDSEKRKWPAPKSYGALLGGD